MFGKLKSFAVKKLLDSQLKNVPQEQRDLIMTLVEKDPALFEKVAKELQAEMKSNGNNQMAAAMKILPKYQKEIMDAMPADMKEKLIKQQMGTQGKFNPNGSIRR
jgi:formate dehydrogenase maturation protein FdhE